MRRALVLAPLLLIGILALAAQAQEGVGADELDVAALLAEIVDQPDAEARAEAALKAVKTPGLTLELALDAARGFGTFGDVECGVHDHDIPGAGSVSVYVPSWYDGTTPLPLVFAHHGTGGSGDRTVSSWSGLAEEHGWLVAAPTTAGENEGYTFSPAERAEALRALRFVRRTYNVDENRIHLTGVSRGGHLSWDLALRHPDAFASASPMIGGPRLNFPNGENNTRFIENVAHLSIRDLQGSNDHPHLVANLEMVFERLSALGARDAELILFEHLGHSYEMSAVDWGDFFGAARRDPFPTRVVRRAVSTDEARAHWAEITKFDRKITEDFRPTIAVKQWAGMTDDEQRRLVFAQIEAATARLEVRRTGTGTYEADSAGVRGFRLLLPTDEMTRENRVEVEWNGRKIRRLARRELEVLLLDFAERFDRTYLPVIEIEVAR